MVADNYQDNTQPDSFYFNAYPYIQPCNTTQLGTNVQSCLGQNLFQQVPMWNFFPANLQLNQNTLATNPIWAAPVQMQAPAPLTRPMTLTTSCIIQPSCIMQQPLPVVSPLPSPILGPIPESNIFFANPGLSPSPSLSASPVIPLHNQNKSLPGNFNLNALVQSFQNVEVQKPQIPAGCEVFFRKPIIKHQATVEKIRQKHSMQLVEAMKMELGFDNLNVYVNAVEINNVMSIYWFAHPGQCDVQALLAKTRTKAFEERLICRLACIERGEFNRHLRGSKQLMIVNEGFRLVHKLGHALMSFDNNLATVLSTPEGNQFDERSKQAIFGVCKAPRGKALRGPNVVGGHFRGTDVLKMMEFVETVEKVIGQVQKATMIPSMKGKSQYKGWSIYIETPSCHFVRTIIQACQHCTFQKVEIFVAIDNFKK